MANGIGKIEIKTGAIYVNESGDSNSGYCPGNLQVFVLYRCNRMEIYMPIFL
jgi:hypothetical protein